MRMQNFAIQFPLKDNKGTWQGGREGGRYAERANKSALSSLLSSNQVTALLECNHAELTHSCVPLARLGHGRSLGTGSLPTTVTTALGKQDFSMADLAWQDTWAKG